MQVCPPEEQGNIVRPSILKRGVGILERESATLVMRNKAKPTSYLAFAAATLLKANGERIFCARCGAVRRDSDTACALLLRPHSSADAPGTFLALRFRADQGARLNRMDDLTSHSEVVHCALCRHWNGATVKISTETIVALI